MGRDTRDGSMNVSGPPVTPERLLQVAWGFAPALMLEAGVRHRVFETLDGGPKTAEEVSAATGASARGLRYLMNGLLGFGLLARDGDGRYTLTAESAAFLVPSRPSYIGGFFRHMSTQLIPGWLHLTETVQSGKPQRAVNEQEPGSEFFVEFVTDLFPLNYPSAGILAQALGVPQAAAPYSVLDLATGSGVWGIGVAQTSPQVTVTAVDWPEVLKVTEQMAARFGLSDRMRYVAGDLADADFGTGHQLATLGHILHSEGPDRSRRLLKKTFDALASGGTIAIAEYLVNEDRTGPPVGLIFAVNMLLHTAEGDTFSLDEIRGWLIGVGFENVRTLDIPGPSPLILADKPGTA
jgi:3-hydroxy-5-methyl-1-naphthoate 3-O-methyltransferase